MPAVNAKPSNAAGTEQAFGASGNGVISGGGIAGEQQEPQQPPE